MALSGSVLGEVRSTATAGNVNAGLFNPNNANMLTSGAALLANTSAPTFSDINYSFTAADVGYPLYIKTGATQGWYPIVSVTAGVATLGASIGQGNIVLNPYFFVGPSIAAGISGSASPTGITWAIDYSQGDSALNAITDLTLPSTTTGTSAAKPFTAAMSGNHMRVNSGTGFTTQWYEIVSVASAVATFDRAVGTAASTSGVANVGGAFSLGGATSTRTDDDVFENITASGCMFIKGGSSITYTLGVAVSIGASGGRIEGYASQRGDRPLGATRPTLSTSASAFTTGSLQYVYSSNFTGTGVSVCVGGSSSRFIGCLCTNIGTTANQNAWSSGANTGYYNCEGVSIRGYAFQLGGANGVIESCYAHDSAVGIHAASTGPITILDTIMSSNVTAAYQQASASTAYTTIKNCTLYGAENKLGIGLSIPAGSNTYSMRNNILYGFASAITSANVTGNFNYSDYNSFNNNTTDITGGTTAWLKGPNDNTIAPGFNGVVQRTGTTATTTATNHLVDSTATFVTWGVTPGRDYLRIVSGTGVTVGIYPILSVDSETQITTTIALTANATADKVWSITVGKDFSIGTNLKAAGSPGAFPAGYSTGYIDTGAVQRQEAGGGGSGGVAKMAGDGGGYVG